MSNQNDPVTAVLDKIFDIKEDTKAAVTTAVTKISQTLPPQVTENEKLRKLGSKVAGVVNSAAETLTGKRWGSSSSPSSAASSTAVGPLLVDPDLPQVGALSSLCTSIHDWVLRNKLLASLIAAASVGGVTYYLYRLNTGYIRGPQILKFCKKKRLARKAANGGRTEVVIIAGSPSEPLTRTIATDLARRGYIIYWTTSSKEEENIVLREGSDDIRPFPITSNDVSSVRISIKALANVLNVPATAFPGAIPHMLTLSGVIVVPDLYYPTGPVESIRVETWSDLVNSKILAPIFLLSNGLLDLVRSHHSRVIMLSPAIMGSLNPGFHAAEGLVTAALDALVLSVSRELAPQQIPFIHIKMGSFDTTHGSSSPAAKVKQQERIVQNQVRADILSWPDHLRAIYARQYQSMSALQTESRCCGEPLRHLNYTVFDALNASRPSSVYYTGRGAYRYHKIPKLLPNGLMSWLLFPKSAPTTVLLERGWEPL